MVVVVEEGGGEGRREGGRRGSFIWLGVKRCWGCGDARVGCDDGWRDEGKHLGGFGDAWCGNAQGLRG